MKRAQILQAVEHAIKTRENPGPHRFRIFWHPDGKIACEPCYYPQRELVFFTVNNATLESGLTAEQWNGLESKIYTILHQKGLI